MLEQAKEFNTMAEPTQSTNISIPAGSPAAQAFFGQGSSQTNSTWIIMAFVAFLVIVWGIWRGHSQSSEEQQTLTRAIDQQAFPAIKALWESLSTGIYGLMLPKPMKESMNHMFKRIAVDKDYALHVYNVFPIICDRYGAGNQQKGRDKGKPRLNFVHMYKDPLCKSLLK